jgi:integrase
VRGSIHKRSNTYSIVYRVADPKTGKSKQVWRGGFTTKKAAEDELKEVVRSIDKGVYIPPTNQTFGEFLKDDWLPSLDNLVAGGKLKPTTATFYRNLTNSHVIPRLGGTPLKALDAPGLNACYRDLLKSGKVNGDGGLSPTTVHSIHVAISKALGDAVKWGKVARNVAALADGPRPNASRRDVWSPEQLRTFLASVAEDRLYALWLLAATTGMRRGELAGLRWTDLDLETGRLHVAQTRVSVGYEVVTTTPKSTSSDRAIGLDPATVAALKAWKNQQTKERLAWGPGWTDTGLVFGKEDGTAHHPQRITQAFARKVKAAELPPIRLHDVRHAYATASLEAGVPIKVLSERLGHSSIQITGDTYQHVRQQVDQDAADLTASFILGAG